MLSKNDYLKISNSQWGRYRVKGYIIPIFDGKLINAIINSNGTITENQVYRTTENFIKTNNKSLTLSVGSVLSEGFRVAYYDENKNFVKRTVTTNTREVNTEIYPYLKFCVQSTYTDLKVSENGVEIYNAVSPLTYHTGVEMSSLLGKQNIKTTLMPEYGNFYCYPLQSGGFLQYASNNSKKTNLVANHKYAHVIKFSENVDNLFSSDTQSRYGSTYPTILSKYKKDNIFLNVLNQQETITTTLGFRNVNYLANQFNVLYNIIVDLTDIGLDNLTAQEFYDKYHNQFDKLANGKTINKPVKYEPSTPLTLRQGDTFTNTNGKNNVVMGSYTFTGNEAWVDWLGSGKTLSLNIFADLIKKPENNNVVPNIICSFGKTLSYNSLINQGGGNEYDICFTTGGRLYLRTTKTPSELKTYMAGKTITYELATPQTNILPSQMIRSGVTKITDANGVELEFDVLGISVAYNQLIPDAQITKTINITSSPSANQLDPYILIKEPSLVGQRVYAKITTSNPKLRVGWYKSLNTGYDFATGTAITSNSAIPTATEGVYEITQDMVHAGTNYLQLYFFKGAGLEVGNHTITIQLISLSQLGMQNIINLPIFKATQLGKLTNRINFEFTGTTNKIYSK